LSQPLQLDVAGAGLAGVDKLAGEWWTPAGDGPLAGSVFCCLSGGGMSRRYWDLRPPNGDASYSMAGYLSARGGSVLLVDPPGVGESPDPDDPWALTPSVLADVVAAAVHEALSGVGAARAVGVGHSMGALLTVHQQARHATFDALGLLGFAGRGQPDGLSAEELAYQPASDPSGAALIAFARARYDAPLRRGRAGGSGGGGANTEFLMAGSTDPVGRAALAEARSALLSVAGLASIIPGASSPQLDAIEVPVFLGVGEHDITGPSHHIPAIFPNSNDVTLFVVPDTGHNHNAADNRLLLWARLAAWAASLP